MRLAILSDSKSLVDELTRLSKTFFELGKKWDCLPKAGRTHLQDAVPMRLGQEFRAYGRTVEKAAHWIEAGRDQLRELGIGGSAVGTGDGPGQPGCTANANPDEELRMEYENGDEGDSDTESPSDKSVPGESPEVD